MLRSLLSGNYVVRVILWLTLIVSCTQAEQYNNTLQQQHTYNNDKILRERHLDQRIVGGSVAAVGEFPSFVYLGCGGSLIHPDIVLTSAHCAGYFSGYPLRIGGIKWNGSDSEQIVAIKEIQHPLFDEVTVRNDVMIVVLANSSSKPIQKLNPNNTIPAINDVVTVIGFGRLSYEGPYYYGVLRKVNVNVVNYQSCRRDYRLRYPIYNDSMVCAGVPGGGKDACQGDSGGPLLTTSGIQVGIVSFGIGCGKNGKPGVYTRIGTYYNWIQQAICNYSSVPPSSCSNPPPTDSSLLLCQCAPSLLWLCRIIFKCL